MKVKRFYNLVVVWQNSKLQFGYFDMNLGVQKCLGVWKYQEWKATAVALAKMGANVTVMARNEEKLQAVLSELDTSQGQSHSYACADFSNVENVKSAAQSITADKNVTS